MPNAIAMPAVPTVVFAPAADGRPRRPSNPEGTPATAANGRWIAWKRVAAAPSGIPG